jgi:Putative esterase
MARRFINRSKLKASWAVRLLLIFSFLLVPAVAFLPSASAASSASDNFNRANGGLGPNWTAFSDGALSIVSDQVMGSSSSDEGDFWSAQSFGSDQFSQITVTSTPLSSGQWIAAAARVQNGGQNGYFGLYFWNFGSPELMLFKRSGGAWTELGAYSSGALSAGTQVQVLAVGSSISLLQNGVQRVAVTDSSITGGAPGIMASGASTAGNWSGGDAAAAGGTTYTVGGSVSGLSGTVVLRDNGGDNLSVSANGSFTFATSLVSGAAYSVTVLTSPSGQACTVSGGSGTVGSANVTNVAVSCTTAATYTVGGSVSGLSGTVVLQDNGGDNLSVSANGSFTFATSLVSGAAYSVTVLTNPSGQACTVSGGAGTVGSANVTSVAVSCAASSGASASDNFNRANGPLGPNWTAFSDGGLSIVSDQVQGSSSSDEGDYWSAQSFGSNQFSQITVTSTPLSGGQWIAAAARVQGSGQNGYFGLYYWNFGSPELMLFKRSGGAWTELGGTYNSGALSAGTQLELLVSGSTVSFLQNGVQRLSVTDTTFTSGAPGIMASGASTAGNWSGGTVGGGGTTSYTVGGSVSGLSGTVVLQDNGGDNLSVSANGSFTFATPVASGAPYSVTVQTNPSGQACTVSGGAGTVGSANVTSVAVSCTTLRKYTVGGSVSGLSGTVVLQDNGGDNLSVSANGSFTFATPVASGAPYSVTVQTNPSGQACTVSGGAGTVASANVTSVAVSCAANTGTSASDNFNRANGPLGANWTPFSVGGMSIVSDQATGTAGADSGDFWSAQSFTSDQFSQITVTSTPMSGDQWIAVGVRVQNGGQNGYFGLYYWNSGSPELMLFKRSSGSWTELTDVATAPLAAGAQLRLVAVGNTIAFQLNGVQQVGTSDGTFTGGAPGIMANSNTAAGNWSGGDAGFQVTYNHTDSTGIQYYDVISANNGYGPQTLRVLSPANPAAGVAHNFLIVLPVEPGLGTNFGDGLATVQSLDAQDKYNLTVIEPTFDMNPWYANNPNDPQMQYETFMTQELVPWIKQNLATTGNEQTWLLGYSKSGLGGQDLILKHPDLFTLAATWDFPADMASYNSLAADAAANYGTDANYQANYRLTQAFVDARKGPFLTNNRIWIGGYGIYQTDDSDYDALLTSEGIAHTTETPTGMAHTWDSGWVPIALAALYQDSLNQH